MVQALKTLIEDEYYNEASVKEALFSFECAYKAEESEDVVYFLQKLAIPYEKDGTTRTYLIINDEEYANDRIQIDGYFSIAIKNIYFKEADEDILEEAFGDKTKKSCPAFLIGQLARGIYSEKGSGAEYLDIALSYIATVSNIIGGRFVYLDCTPERQSYYEAQGFAFLQHKHRSELIQMYRII